MSKKGREKALQKAVAEFKYEAPDAAAVVNEDIAAEAFAYIQLEGKIRDQAFQGKPIGFFKDAWLRFKANKASLIALIIIIFVIICAIVGPMIRPYTFRDQHTSFGVLPPRVQFIEKLGFMDGTTKMEIQEAELEDYGDAVVEIISRYSWTYRNREIPMVVAKINMYTLKGAQDHYFWFGTDNIGRDMFVRVWRGARISLLIGFVSVLINCLIGVVYGSISGYYGGTADMLMQRFTEILGSIPFLVISILFIMVMGAGIQSFILVLILVNWIPMSRMIRAQFYRYKDYEYVMASRTMGVKDHVLIFRHILPNAIGPIITQATLAIPGAIFSESFLSYLGLGIQAPEPSIGVLLAEGQKKLTTSPQLTLFPAIVVSVLMLAFNIFGNGLRDAFDPRLRGVE
ncbi:MAG: ABC transporter permease [Clostridiales bacterium]|nr:ABC transporter permease [Clostridiales bacterium]